MNVAEDGGHNFGLCVEKGFSEFGEARRAGSHGDDIGASFEAATTCLLGVGDDDGVLACCCGGWGACMARVREM